MFKAFYFCGIEYQSKVESFINTWQSGIETLSIQTSGSTGNPKLIEIKRKQFLASVEFTKNNFGLNQSSKALSNLHIDYIAGKMMLIRAIEIGFEIDVVEPSSNPFLVVPSERYYDFLSFVPLQIETIIDSQTSIDKLNKAQSIIIGGAAVNSNLKQKLQSIKSPVFATYGMTETVTHIAKKQLNGVKQSEYFEIFDGVEIKKNEDNCLEIKSESTDNLWITTNDIVEIFEDDNNQQFDFKKIDLTLNPSTEGVETSFKTIKYFKLIGRKDNIINSGGVKIQLEKVENILAEFIQNRFFCWGIKDEKLGQKLVVFIEQKSNFSNENQIKSEKLTKFEVPKAYFSIESFIETPSAKIDKIKTVNAYFQNSISNF
jgi:o-succinylbenzoate---CoA ligase